ncbi:hypothetical protein PPS11_04505 [Pseudomonas putida S11]|nr:hypothetical protein PPS11_04505 [Pseudomonas putida S11]
MQATEPLCQRRQALVHCMRTPLPCQAQAAPCPGKVPAALARRDGGDQYIRRSMRLQRKAHRGRQLQVQATP